MKKLLLIIALLALTVLQQGCYKQQRGINEQKGMHLDKVAHHRQSINQIDPQIYLQNLKVLPMIDEQVSDTSSFQNNMRSRMQGMKGGR